MSSLSRALLAVTLAFALIAATPNPAGAGDPWREVSFKADGRIESDGVRFAWVRKWLPDFQEGPVRVFDTRRGRSFWLRSPRPECTFGDIGGGLALWRCPEPREALLTNLATLRDRTPAGLRRIEALENTYSFCGPDFSVGRHWLQVRCRGTLGPSSDPYYLNHRTGFLTGEFTQGPVPPSPRLDLDSRRVVRSVCRPLRRAPLAAYEPPLGLEAPAEVTRQIRLRRCGQRRAEIVSRCPSDRCRTAQLGSRYVTWGEKRRAFAYLPGSGRRLLVGRTPKKISGPLSVVHTCDRVFAQWGRRVYIARFEPREGAPPCQR